MQKKIKKLCLIILSVLTLAFTATACDNIKTPSTPSNSENGVVDGSGENNNNGENNNGNNEDKNPENDPFYIWAGSVMDDAYLLPKNEYLLGYYELSGTVTEIDDANSTNSAISLYFNVYEPQGRKMYCYKLTGNGVQDISVGDFITVYGRIMNYKDEKIEFDEGCELISIGNDGGSGGGSTMPPSLDGDPYANMSKTAFYADYTPATSADDAYYRSLHGFMSGELETPDQAPTISSYQPKKDGKFIRNSVMNLSEDGKTYTVVDAYGKEAFKVYKGGAYITLEEVAAYVYAFGSYPSNYDPSDDIKNSSSNIWGEYLRINHKRFSGSTSKYPYEPELPNISGCGGTLEYYEMDIGTTGTDCDPSYPSKLYNNGSTITRGAARIVYGKNDLDNDGVYEIGEFHVFYTYNHYNDFQEYLNYEGGWGEMFGNITGGGSISSKYDYSPTDYVEIVLEALPASSIASTSEVFYYDDKKFLTAMSYPIFCVA